MTTMNTNYFLPDIIDATIKKCIIENPKLNQLELSILLGISLRSLQRHIIRLELNTGKGKLTRTKRLALCKSLK